MLERARRSLIWLNLLVTFALVVILIGAMYWSVSSSIERQIATDLTKNADTLLKSIEFAPPKSPDPSASPSITSTDDVKLEIKPNLNIKLSDAFYSVVSYKGKVILNPKDFDTKLLPDVSGLDRVLKGQSFFQDKQLENYRVRLYSVPVRQNDAEGTIVGMLQVGKKLGPYEEQIQSVLLTTGLVALLGLGLALAAAFFLTARALVPVRNSLTRQREFVADASHELRTPLTLIRANAEVALRNPTKTVAEQADLIQDIRYETEYLTRLVSDLLTLARSDSGELEVSPELVDMAELAREVVAQIQPLADDKKLALELQLSGPPRLWILADPLRLRQLLLILLDNAIKYTPQGAIYLRIKPLNKGRTPSLLIEVEDSGVGIPSGQLEQIFERFYRVDKARSRSEGGFGLGLSIARWIVEIHDGTINVTSQPNQGTTFTITLPTKTK